MAPAPVRILDLDYRAFAHRVRENPLVILPIGALEAHGPHLPLGADQIQAELTAIALAERMQALVAPTVAYGSTPNTRGFPGTVCLSMAQLGTHVAGVLGELARWGVRRILVLSGHGERSHIAALREASDETVRAHPEVRIVVLCDYEFVYELRGKEAPITDGHAGLLETSRMMALAPERVGTERPSAENRHSPFVPGPPTATEWPESVIGDSHGASPELGNRVQAYVLDRLADTVGALLPA